MQIKTSRAILRVFTSILVAIALLSCTENVKLDLNGEGKNKKAPQDAGWSELNKNFAIESCAEIQTSKSKCACFVDKASMQYSYDEFSLDPEKVYGELDSAGECRLGAGQTESFDKKVNQPTSVSSKSLYWSNPGVLIKGLRTDAERHYVVSNKAGQVGVVYVQAKWRKEGAKVKDTSIETSSLISLRSFDGGISFELSKTIDQMGSDYSFKPWLPKAAMNDEGSMVAIWTDQKTHLLNKGELYASFLAKGKGSRWSEKVLLSSSMIYHYQIAYDPTNKAFWVAYAYQTDNDYTGIKVRKFDLDAKQWREPIVITPSLENFNFIAPKIFITENGHGTLVFKAYRRDTDEARERELSIWSSELKGAEWGKMSEITDAESRSNAKQNPAALKMNDDLNVSLDQNGNRIVTWSYMPNDYVSGAFNTIALWLNYKSAAGKVTSELISRLDKSKKPLYQSKYSEVVFNESGGALIIWRETVERGANEVYYSRYYSPESSYLHPIVGVNQGQKATWYLDVIPIGEDFLAAYSFSTLENEKLKHVVHTNIFNVKNTSWGQARRITDTVYEEDGAYPRFYQAENNSIGIIWRQHHQGTRGLMHARSEY